VSVAVVTDSTPYLPPHLVERWGVKEVALYVGWDADLRPEPEYDDLDLFYMRLKESPTLPVTSQPSVGDFLHVYEPLAEAGHDIVSVHIAEGLSGTCESGREAGRIVEEKHGTRVQVVDGATGAGGLGCLVIAAARAAEAGEGVDAVVRAIHDTRERLDIWFCLDTLEYLRRGGRIGRAAALAGTLLSVKPILTIRDDEVVPLKRVRGMQKAFDEFRAALEAGSRDEPTLRIGLAHAAAPERLAKLEAIVREARPRAKIEVATSLGPVLGTHAGPGTVGLFWFDDPVL
jgi:DegV family protein with EDD domain